MTDALIDALRGDSGGSVSKRSRDGDDLKQTRRLAKALGKRAGLTKSQRAELADWMERRGR